MLIRIVKMTFKAEHVRDFQTLFNESKYFIAAYKGCKGVELLNDICNPAVFFTYSKWESEEALNKYRNSELFNGVWSKVRLWFDDKPQAWSATQVMS